MELRRDRARQLRRDSTEAEAKLWSRLRSRRLAHTKFYRNYSIGRFYADFFSLEARLIVEVDGSQHVDAVGDQPRTEFLNECGYRVLRFWNNEVLGNIDGIAQSIADAIEEFRHAANS
jgi:adenine-specific DNA-methyltransferase